MNKSGKIGAVISLGVKDFIDASCEKLPLGRVPSPSTNGFADIKKFKHDNGDTVIDAKYDGVGGRDVRWRFGSCGDLKAFYVYKTEIEINSQAANGHTCRWSECYNKKLEYLTF